MVFLIVFLSGPITRLIFTYHNYKTLLSLAHSLTTRGDTLGDARARSLADHIEAAVRLAFRLYASNSAWRSDWETYRKVYGAVSELNDLVSRLRDYARVHGERERVEWFHRIYQNVLGSAKAVFERLLGVFARSGPLRDAVEAMRKEVVDGDFPTDCLEIGGNDLKGIIQVLMDLFDARSIG